jgi:transglutaminase-like putative cysteine protease
VRLTAQAAFATIACATALSSVFSDRGWVVPVIGAVVVVAGSCALVRASPLPSMFEPIVAAVMVLLWVTFLDERSHAHLGFIPGRLAFHRLGTLAHSGFNEIHQLPTPVPARSGVVLLTVVGVAAIALVVDLLTVTMRHAALAGLPLLALFAVAAATGHNGVNIFAFIAAAIGYLWLLYADNREKVARWGAAVGTGRRARPASTWSTDTSGGSAPGSLARRVAATAIGIGVVVPLALPGLHTGIDKHGTGGDGGGSGGGTKIVVNPIVTVSASLTSRTNQPVITYTSSSPDPGYLRLTSDDLIQGVTFSAPVLRAPPTSAVSAKLPVTTPPGSPVTTNIHISPSLTVSWLPVEETATGVTASHDWLYDRATSTIFSSNTTTGGLNYAVVSVPNQPTAEELSGSPPAISSTLSSAVAADLAVPSAVPTSVLNLTRSVIAGATTPYARAVAIEQFFTGPSSPFTYDTTVKPVDSPAALSDFLLRTHRGFCQQYSGAMAMMARVAGIPSRVAVGFTPGTQQAGGSWLVTTHDYHAWPELYFVGYGWLPFEPTPRGDGQARVPAYAKGTAGGAGHNQAGGSNKSKRTNSALSNLPPKPTAGFAPGTTIGGSGSSSSKSSQAMSAGLLVLIVIAVLLALPAVFRLISRSHRHRQLHDSDAASGAAWAELRDTAVDLSLPWDDGQTPRQNATGLIGTLPADPHVRSALFRLALTEERARYAPAQEFPLDGLYSDLQTTTRAATAASSRSTRLRARLFPRSTVQAAAAGLAALRATIDRATAGLRRRTRRPRPATH